MQAERREAFMAVARFLMRHGRDSSQWRECLATADALLDAARESSDAPEQATSWLLQATSSVGNGAGDATPVTAGLPNPAQWPAGPAGGAPGTRPPSETARTAS